MDRELKNLTLNISQLAALSGVHRQTAAARLQNLPVAGGHESNLKLYRVVDIVSAFLALPPPVAEGEMDAHERKAWYQSERERLKFEQETAQLIPASDVRREFAIWAKAVVQVLETLPDILERDCGLQPAAVSRVQSIIDDLRDQIDVANKAILQGWEEAPETYEQWTRKGQLSDFKIAHRVGMGGFSSLRQVREGAEYKYVTTGDKQATIALATYGELFSITRQAIINDDLNMLTDVPMKLGRAAKSTIADLVYAILTSNPKISTDNVSLFDKAKHANVLESAAMDVASLDKARQLMRVQKEGERHLNIRPAFVLVPTAMESVANQVIRSSSVKGADINAGIINPVKDFATVIAEPRLDDNSQTTFYLAAAKGTDTIEVAYLNGVDTPYIDQMEGFSVDGVTTKVRIDAGVAPVDHRGLVKCTA